MGSPSGRYIYTGLAIVVLLVVILIPVVPYTLQVDNPGFPYQLQGYRACEAQFTTNNTISSSTYSSPAFLHCVSPFLIPPINVTGYGSPSFKLFGVGVQPFPSRFLVSETGFNAYLYIKGASISAAQVVQETEVTYDPAGIEISNSSLSQGLLGGSNLTVTVMNHSDQTLINPLVWASVPGSSGNFTDKNGVTWIFSLGVGFGGGPQQELIEFSPCLTDGGFANLTAGASCTAVLHAVTTAPFGSSFRYTVEVQGILGSRASITKRTFSYSLSPQAADRLWVNAFIGLVNAARGGIPLSESSTLDNFARQRFSSAVTQPDISDYGFGADVSSYFRANATKPIISEDLLYPNMTTQDPYTYASILQGSAPGHWASLTDKNYTHFGYYFGTGPYEVVQQPCPVTEIPGGGINITQFFENAGCSVSVQQATWLVVVLS